MEEKIQELEQISKPIVEFLKANYNPHTTVIISENSIKVVNDEICIPLVLRREWGRVEKLTLYELFMIKHCLEQEVENLEINIQQWEDDKEIKEIFIDRQETILSILKKLK